jgi:hypothetical protein
MQDSNDFFLNFAVSELFSLERVQKMLQNEPLDVKTFDDTAENEAFQIPKIVKIPDLQGRPCLYHWKNTSLEHDSYPSSTPLCDLGS